jgi:hypothetical protein
MSSMTKLRRPQAKHVPIARVIRAISIEASNKAQQYAMPEAFVYVHEEALMRHFPDFPAKVVRARLRALRKRGYIDGCACGCRGDWNLEAPGRELLSAVDR